MKLHNEGPFTSDEQKRLEAFLSRAGDRAMPLESIDGLFAALVCSPVLVPPSQWMPLIWDGEPPPAWNSDAELEEFTGLIMRFWNSVATSIDDGTYAPLFSVVIDEHEKELLLPDWWCFGFLDGMYLHEDLWLQDDNLELGDLLAPIRAILVNLIDTPAAEKLPLQEIVELGELIPEHVMMLREYWLDNPVTDVASRAHAPRPHRAPPKVRRNDPCPCGSGKKFKHCHGGGEALH